eukprot:5075253-Pyramimonas_sp.AAC.1
MEAREENRHARARLDEMLANGKRGKRQRYFSVKGGLTHALRRCNSRTAAIAYGLSVRSDISHATLGRWERTAHAALVSAFSASQKLARSQIYHDNQDSSWSPGLRVVVHRLRADATNAS